MVRTTARRIGHRSETVFEQYVTGQRALLTGAVFFLETAEHLDEVRRSTARGDIVIAPRAAGLDDDVTSAPGAAVVAYDGSWQEPGDQVTLHGAHVFELQDYVAMPFLSIVGPTVVRQRKAAGVSALLSDADCARYSGILVNQLLSSAVLFDSHASFTRPDPIAGSLVRVHVTADGEYRDGPDGLLLGRVGDERGDVEAAVLADTDRGRCFARIVDRAAFAAELDARPWFERYLAVLDLLRRWGGARMRPTVSGFGGHLVSALDQHDAVPAIVSPSAPFLVTGDGEEFVLVTQDARHRLRLGADDARAAECLIAAGEEPGAIDLLAAELGSSLRTAANAISAVRGRARDHGIDLTAFVPRIGQPA